MADDNVFSLEEFLRNPMSLGRRAAPTPAPEPVMQEYIPKLPAPLYSPMSQPMGMLNNSHRRVGRVWRISMGMEII